MDHSAFTAKQLFRYVRRWIYELLVIVSFNIQLTGISYAFDTLPVNPPRQIILQGGKLTARFTATPLRQTIETISKVSGARVRWFGSVEKERLVSVAFTALPLPEALRQILGEANFILFYSSRRKDAALIQIWISSRRTGDEPHEVSLSLPIADSQSESVEGRISEVDTALVNTLIQTAMSTQAPGVRVEAIAKLGHYALADPRAEDILSHLAANESDPLVRAAAAEVLEGIASQE